MDTVIRRSILRTRRGTARSNRSRTGINAGLLVLALTAVLSWPSGTPRLRAGDVAGETVVAQHRVTFADHLATTARRKQAIASVPVTYRPDSTAAAEARRRAATLLSRVAGIAASGAGPAARNAAIRSLLPPGVSPAGVQALFVLTPAQLAVVKTRTLLLLQQAEAWHFNADQVQSTGLSLLGTIPPSVSMRARTAIGEMLSAFLTPTEAPDLAATSAKQRAAAARVPTVYTTVAAGQVIVRRGDLVTASIAEELDALGLRSHQIGWRDVLSSLLFAAIVVTMLIWYLSAFQGELLDRPRLLLLIDAAILICVIGAHLLQGGHVLIPFLLPVAAVTTFAAVLIAPEACIALGLAIALLAGWIVANSFELMLYYFISGAAGVLAIRKAQKLKQFMQAGIAIAFFAFATTLAFSLVNHNYDFAALEEYVLVSAANGFGSSALALGGFALLSGFFGVTTTLQLYELGQPSQPLLRRLTGRAPGTYNHSLVVASMVEQAAEAIGANSLVAKVCALYHDVGKTVNPHSFAENQLGIGNIHDDLRSDESARIIRGHVTQGVRLARQYRLPAPIMDAIREHHGTMTLSYFIHKARQETDGTPIDLSVYTYPGPKPQTKETALLMLADGCESAVRAGHDHSAEAIRATVRAIVRERMDNGQLDECPLTLRDLDLTQTAFCQVLTALYHPRIEYPDQRELQPATPETA